MPKQLTAESAEDCWPPLIDSLSQQPRKRRLVCSVWSAASGLRRLVCSVWRGEEKDPQPESLEPESLSNAKG